MRDYLIFTAILCIVYAGYLIMQARQRKRMQEYFGDIDPKSKWDKEVK